MKNFRSTDRTGGQLKISEWYVSERWEVKIGRRSHQESLRGGEAQKSWGKKKKKGNSSKKARTAIRGAKISCCVRLSQSERRKGCGGKGSPNTEDKPLSTEVEPSKREFVGRKENRQIHEKRKLGQGDKEKKEQGDGGLISRDGNWLR